jgi:pyridinium-3,5-biscarboxylic acid mononucleotide synthase
VGTERINERKSAISALKPPAAMSQENALVELLEAVAGGLLSPEQAARRLAVEPHPHFARIDFDREARCGFPEVVLAQGKTPEECATIAAAIFERAGRVLVTRASSEHARAVEALVPAARWDERSRLLRAERTPPEGAGLVAVIAAGTADLPVAGEAAGTAEAMGARVELHVDVGVAGIHRVLGIADRLREASAVVAVAGMEGALASVTGGLIDRPVIAVPTSTGYGASFGGLAALLGMLNSCAPNVSVVNIDNGFGAGYLAALINRARVEGRAHA